MNLPPTSPRQRISYGDSESLANFREAQRLLNSNSTIVDKNKSDNTLTVKENRPDENTIDNTICDRHVQEAVNLEPIGQIDRCFIVAQGGDGGMYIIDQHAAHERILYDKFSKQSNDRLAVQPLLVHLLLDVNNDEMEIIEDNQPLLYQLGFYIELAGSNQIRLIEVPADINSADSEIIFRKILASLTQLHQPTPQEIRHSCLAMTACKAAIKAGDVLTIPQMKIILTELAQTTLPYTCPHGRPTIIKFSAYDLDKMFKRVK